MGLGGAGLRRRVPEVTAMAELFAVYVWHSAMAQCLGSLFPRLAQGGERRGPVEVQEEWLDVPAFPFRVSLSREA